MRADGFVISRRFRGPATSGNGGYTAGMLAGLLTTEPVPIRVVLRRPPPLDRPLVVRSISSPTGSLELADGDDVIATAATAELGGRPVAAVSTDAARAVESTYKGLHDHPFPGCFVCGTDRQPGDGLRLRPGMVGAGRTACSWRPDPSLADPADDGLVSPEFVWAALDCPGGWTSDLEARPLVLGTMTTICRTKPRVHDDYVVVGALLAEEGRKTTTATALYDDSGGLLAQAEQVWIAVDPAAFGG